MEYNNTSHFLHSLHNHLSTYNDDGISKIHRTLNQNEISELLVIGKDEISVEDSQLEYNTMTLGNGSLTERNLNTSGKSSILPSLPKYQNR